MPPPTNGRIRPTCGRYTSVTSGGTTLASPSSGPSGGTPVGMKPSAYGASESVASVPVARSFTENGKPSTVSSESWPSSTGST